MKTVLVDEVDCLVSDIGEIYKGRIVGSSLF